MQGVNAETWLQKSIRKDWETKQLAAESIERQNRRQNFKVKPGTDRPLREDSENERGMPLFSFAEQIHAVDPKGKPQIIKPLPL